MSRRRRSALRQEWRMKGKCAPEGIVIKQWGEGSEACKMVWHPAPHLVLLPVLVHKVEESHKATLQRRAQGSRWSTMQAKVSETSKTGEQEILMKNVNLIQRETGSHTGRTESLLKPRLYRTPSKTTWKRNENSAPILTPRAFFSLINSSSPFLNFQHFV